jgi:hypothetical protein
MAHRGEKIVFELKFLLEAFETNHKDFGGINLKPPNSDVV